MIGSRISHYEVLEKLGAGGMGIVYKCRDIKLDRQVAIKFLPPSASENEEQKMRFINEAKAASALDHINLGTIHEIDQTEEGHLFMVMAYYDGDTLKKKIEAGGIAIEEVLDYVMQVAAGLSAAHKHGIIHRDLKPANVLIARDGIAKIIDFGLAKLKGGGNLTRTGVSVGTAAYMSPEQACGEEVDQTTDIWALGVILYELLTGKLPFQAEFEAAMLYLIVNQEPPSPTQFRGDIPVRLEGIITRAMKKNRSERYADVDEMLSDLLSIKKALDRGEDLEDGRPEKKKVVPVIRIALNAITLYSLSGVILALVGFLVFRLITGSEDFTSADRSILVKPVVIDGPIEHEFLTDGLTRNIIRRLSDVSKVTVVSSSTAFLYKDVNTSPDSLAERLGVRFVLTAKLRPIGTRLLLNASIYDSKTKQNVGEKNLEDARANLLAIEEQVAQLGMSVLKVEGASVSHRRDPGAKAYEAYLRGVYSLDKGKKSDHALAIEFFTQSIAQDSAFARAYEALADAQAYGYERQWIASDDVLNQAGKNVRKALELDSSSARGYVILSDIERLRGRQHESIAILQRALLIKPDDAAALTTLALFHLMELNKPALGLVYLKKLQDADPTDWITSMNVGIGYGQLKDYHQAVQFFQRTIKLNSRYPDVWVNLGYAYERLLQYDSAITSYRGAVERDYEGPLAYNSLAELILVLGKFASAESILTEALKVLPGNHELLYRLGTTYLLQGKMKKAREIYQQGIESLQSKLRRNSAFAPLYADYGLFQARLGRDVEALTAARTAFQLDSTTSEISLSQARIFAILGRKDEMLRSFSRAKAMNVEYDIAYISTAIDFERYRNDPDLRRIAGDQ